MNRQSRRALLVSLLTWSAVACGMPSDLLNKFERHAPEGGEVVIADLLGPGAEALCVLADGEPHGPCVTDELRCRAINAAQAEYGRLNPEYNYFVALYEQHASVERFHKQSTELIAIPVDVDYCTPADQSVRITHARGIREWVMRF